MAQVRDPKTGQYQSGGGTSYKNADGKKVVVGGAREGAGPIEQKFVKSFKSAKDSEGMRKAKRDLEQDVINAPKGTNFEIKMEHGIVEYRKHTNRWNVGLRQGVGYTNQMMDDKEVAYSLSHNFMVVNNLYKSAGG